MPTFEFTPAQRLSYPIVPLVEIDYTPQDILDWLVEQGVPATNVTSHDNDDGTLTYVVESDVDPRTILQGARMPRPHERARTFLTNLDSNVLVSGSATNLQVQRAIAAIKTLLGM
jgi:hypothetical protein